MIIPPDIIETVADDLGMNTDEVRAIVESGVLTERRDDPEVIRVLAQCFGWTFGEGQFVVQHVRRRLVELGHLDDPQT